MARQRDRSNTQPGEILGLGRIVPERDHIPGTTTPDSEVRRRHQRMSEGADEVVPDTQSTPARHGNGYESTDMGAGGEGTDIE
jgi:hypothetical protein